MATVIIATITVILAGAFYWLGCYEERLNARDERAAQAESDRFLCALHEAEMRQTP